MPTIDLGANEFTFTGDRTQVTYFPLISFGPVHQGQEGGELIYQDRDGKRTFRGKEIEVLDSPLGTLVTVALSANTGGGSRAFTVLVPKIFEVTRDKPVAFVTVGFTTSSRGTFVSPGADLTYTVLPLLAEAKDVILPV
jgi:hypothetical protein